MNKSKRIIYAFYPLILALCLYLVFYSKIETKPTDAGFWFIIALGMAFGVTLTRFFHWLKTRKSEGE